MCISASSLVDTVASDIISYCRPIALQPPNMMTSSDGNIFCVTGHLCGEFTGDRWTPRTKASDAGLWYFLLICAWINIWVIIGEAGDLRRHRAHYDVTVMKIEQGGICKLNISVISVWTLGMYHQESNMLCWHTWIYPTIAYFHSGLSITLR